MYYTTCPKCAKHYDKNHVVILAEVQKFSYRSRGLTKSMGSANPQPLARCL